MASESAYQEFTGKSVEEALKIACETFKVGLADLDFEIIAPGSKGVLGMGAEPARIVAAPEAAHRPRATAAGHVHTGHERLVLEHVHGPLLRGLHAQRVDVLQLVRVRR